MPTGELALVFTDIEGSSELWERFGVAFAPALEIVNRILRTEAASTSGVEVKSLGDGMMFSFESSTEAVRFMIAAQAALLDVDWAEAVSTLLDVKVRIGAHSGEVFSGAQLSGAADYLGPTANRAARLCDAAHGGQVLISERMVGECAGLAGISFSDLGAYRLKGVGDKRLFQVGHASLPNSFPAPRAMRKERHNLPVMANAFVGREELTRSVTEALQLPDTKLVTLFGPGGVGKSRLALHCAEAMAESFDDGVWWIDLEGLKGARDALLRVANVLGVQPQPQAPLEAQVRERLAGMKALLIFDGAENSPEFPELLGKLTTAGRALKSLATSRRTLDLRAERVVEVEPLPKLDAQSLFLRRASARSSSFELTESNEADVAELCTWLEGLPLAIELAASRVLSLTPREILARSKERLEILKTTAPDVPPRQRALLAVIEWSLGMLSEPGTALFATLGAFAPNFTLADVEAIFDSPDTLDCIEELRRSSLLRTETDASQETRFAMLNVIHGSAVMKLAKAPHARSIRARHAAHFAQIAEECLGALRSAGESGALERFEKSFENFSRALLWCEEVGERKLGVRLAQSLGTYLQRRGIAAEGLAVVTRGLLLAAGAGPGSRSELLLVRVSLLCDLLRLDEAESDLSLSNSLIDDSGSANGARAQAHILEGVILQGRGRHEQALAAFELARGLFAASGNEIGVAMADNNLGFAQIERGEDLGAARRHLQSALEAWLRRGDSRGAAESLTNLGLIAMELNDAAEARSCHRKALRQEAALGNKFGVGRSLFNLAEVAEKSDDPGAAAYLYAGAEREFAAIGSPYAAQAGEGLERAAAMLGWGDPKSDALRQAVSSVPVESVIERACSDGVALAIAEVVG